MLSPSPAPSNSPTTSKLSREPLAVIGIGCRLPGGIDSPGSFWEALLQGVDAICEVPTDRWNHDRFHDTNPEKSGVIRNAKGGFIEGVDLFDGEFFGYYPAAAQRIDPQQRLLLEVTHEAMEDAGIRRDQLDGSRTAVFIGSFMYDYLCMQSQSDQRDEITAPVAMGTAICSLANRISYDFNLTGPSITLDTACSASLTALHLACQSVWNDEAEMAIAGGVNVMLRPEPSIMLSKGGFLNPDQYCKAFDESANGYVRGEGVGVVLLKPMRQAIADGDLVYACVRGSAANQDGYLPEGYTVPNVFSQVALLETVYAQAGIDPADVDYVEAHGTGTPVGDPVETSALGSVLGFERTEDQNNLIIGSVKTNLGHLEGASGITGFIKASLATHHRVAPPNLHFNQPNPAIPWEHYRLEVPTKPTPLDSGDRPLTVGVNSFGAGGANAHVVLQEPGQTNGRSKSDTWSAGRATLYTISASNRDALNALALRHADFLRSTDQPLADIAYSAFSRRSHYTQSLAIVGHDAAEIEGKLRRFADGQVDPETVTAKISHTKTPKVAFVFSGQGGQWARMGLDLVKQEPVFAESMQQIDGLFQELAGWSLLAELEKNEAESKLNDTVVVQPAVMAIQISLVGLYAHYGIHPEGAVGHSIGEVAAAYASGALTLEQAVQVIYHRSQAQDRASGKGGMLAVGLSYEEARELIDGHQGVSIGAVNGPEFLTLSGDSEPLELIAELMESRGIFNRPVKVQVAYHSHHMEPIEGLMLETLHDVDGVKAAIPLYSTVTGTRETGEHLGAPYWYQNVRQPVLFTDALEDMVKDGFDTFIEIGPHPVLVRGAEALIKNLGTDTMIAPAMTRSEPEVTVFLQSLARLAARGAEPDHTAMFGTDRHFVRLPKYPWQHQRYWFESPAAAVKRRGEFEHPFLKRKSQMVTEEGLALWDAAIDVQKFPYLRDHQVDGEIVFPATGHMELAWAVANEQFREGSFFIENLNFDLPLVLPEGSRHPLDVQLEIVSHEGDYRICSRTAEQVSGQGTWTRHSTGRINTARDRFVTTDLSLAELQDRFADEDDWAIDQFYEHLYAAGLAYGPQFQLIQRLQHHELERGTHEWLAELKLPDELRRESHRKAVHPALLDSCLHVVFADVHRLGHPERIYLPHRIDRVRFHRRPTQRVWARVLITRNDEQYLCSDTVLFDENGEIVAEVLGLKGKRLAAAGSQQTDSVYDGCYEYRWTPVSWDPDIHVRNTDFSTAVIIASDQQGPEETQILQKVTSQLSDTGVNTRMIAVGTEDKYEELIGDVVLDRRTLLIFAAGLTKGKTGWDDLSDCPQVPALLHLAQMLLRNEGVPRLCVVTSGATHTAGDQGLDLGQSILHGMSRVINNECPSVPLTLIDLSSDITELEVDALVRELLHNRRDRDESEVALRGQERMVRQLLPVNRDFAEYAAMSEEAGCGGAYRADLDEPGMLENISFRRLQAAEPSDGEVEIEVQAAGLSFRDVMNAMGMLNEDAVAGGLTEQRLGLDIAGRVVRTGSEVTHVKPGDEVMARVSEGFCGRVIAAGDHVVPKPANLTAVQAASIPLVYVTAWYSLIHLARLTAGETVLIHSAAGGVGSAAIAVAKRVGAKVIATAGTKEKRELLQSQDIQHVFDSRSLDFSNQVMEVTDGHGVDVVLNVLSGRFVTQSIKCVAPFGRFVELGKTDVTRNKLGLERLAENKSFFVVDVDRLASQKPGLHAQIFTEVAAAVERGELTVPEITEFPISRLPEAMKFMTRSAYSGKIVLNMQDDVVRTLPPRKATFRPDRTYLISGGASGFGLEVARWMADRGARHLALLSRSGPKIDTDRESIDEMRSRGVQIQLPQADVTSRAEIDQVIADIRNQSVPLAGVFHAAAVMDDATIPNIDMKRFDKVFQPKAQGAWNLHEATLAAGCELEFFVMCSSISSALGFIGQVNYAAANYFEDAIAEYRQQQGLPATSLNLGVLGQYAGLSREVNENQDVIGILESYGMLVMLLSDVLAKIEGAIVQQPAGRMTAQIDWPWFRIAYPHLARDARFTELMGDAALARAFRPKGSGLRSELTEMEPEEQLERLQQELTGKLAQILEADPEKLDQSVSIDNFGLDSLMLTELQVWIGRLLDITLPLIKLLKGPSISSLAAELIADLENSDDDDPEAAGDDGADFTIADMEGIHVLNPWLVRGAGNPDADKRLFCFHSMGVGASLYTNFLVNPPEGYDILAIQTPGRENRRKEPHAQNVDELVQQIVPAMLPLLDRPIVIWGHSFGGIVASEVARCLRDQHDQEPAHIVISGTMAPHLIHLWQNREGIARAMVDDNSTEYLMSMSRYVDDAEFLKVLLPRLKDDWPLMLNYRFRELQPFTCPITAFAARQDDMVYTDEVQEWRNHTRSFELLEVEGDHWFLNRNRDQIAEKLQEIAGHHATPDRVTPLPTS